MSQEVPPDEASCQNASSDGSIVQDTGTDVTIELDAPSYSNLASEPTAMQDVATPPPPTQPEVVRVVESYYENQRRTTLFHSSYSEDMLFNSLIDREAFTTKV